MPSHPSHLIFALRIAGQNLSDSLDIVELNRGAQAPDMFYHNRRTRPSGLYISGAIHRRGFGNLAARVIVRSRQYGRPGSLFALGFLSHAVLDRYLHPFINFRTGWEGLQGYGGGAYRYQHTLCERFVDLWSSRTFGFEWTRNAEFAERFGPHPRFDGEGIHAVSVFDEVTKINPVPFPEPGYSILAPSLADIYPKIANDELLTQRFANAWRDSRGYYHWTSKMGREEYNAALNNVFAAWRRIRSDKEEDGDDGALRFAAIINPRVERPSLLLDDVDHYNLGRRAWHDPCAQSIERNESLPDLWEMAERHASEVLERLKQIGFDLRAEIGDTNSNDGKKIDKENFHPSRQGLTSVDVEDLETEVRRIREALGDLIDDGDLRSFARSGEGCDIDACEPIDWFEVWFKLEGLI